MDVPIARSRRVLRGALLRAKPLPAPLRVERGAASDEELISGALGAQRHGCRTWETPAGGASRSFGLGSRVRDRRPKGRRKSSASSVDRRRPGPGKVVPLHGGAVEAVSAISFESVRAFREKAREKSEPVSSRVATGASEARSSVVRGPTGTSKRGTWGTSEEHAPTASRDQLKRNGAS